MMYLYYNRSEWPHSLEKMYKVAGIFRQGFHQFLQRHHRSAEEQQFILEMIRQIREDHPTMCCRYMYYKINPLHMGRDRFEDLCRAHGFMVKPKRSGRRTTDSSGVKRFDNLVEDLIIDRIDQVWSSDITYFEVNQAFYYLTFVLDNHSRRILGHSISSRLLTDHTTLPALNQAVETRRNRLPLGLIFHSDGGGQYYAESFLKRTTQLGIRNSMCKEAYQNGKAERINGVIKNNYLKHWPINDLNSLSKAVDRAVQLYNYDKPHKMLDRKSPVEFEKTIATLEGQNESINEESVDAISQINRASSPRLSEQNESPISEIVSAI